MSLLSEQIASCLSAASWIRRMFEEATILRRKYGADNVFDFSPASSPGTPGRACGQTEELTNHPRRAFTASV
ncbi:MAG: hypothetical protein U1D30_15480 [Planctomycetota bacterium]